MKTWKKAGALVCSMILISSLLVITALGGETASPEQIGGKLSQLETAVKAEELLQQTITAGGREDVVANPVIIESDTDAVQAPEADSVQGITAKKVSREKPFTLTTIQDYDTKATMGRCYAPSDYIVTNVLMYAGDGVSDCSASTPYQLAILATSPDGEAAMIYKSKMTYLYPAPGDYIEGQLFNGLDMMLYPMTAGEYSDYMMLMSAAGASEIYRVEAHYSTDEDDPYLAEQSNYYLNYMNAGSSAFGMVECDQVYTTSADSTYVCELDGQVLKTRIITMTNQLRFMMYGTIATVTDYEMYVPYVYMLTATEDAFDAANEAFDLFVSNTRVTDEFVILNAMQSQDLISILNTGWPYYDNLDEQKDEILGSGYGTYDTEQFCDYILDQNDYTTSDGRSFKVPTSYDYVYEGDDGTIYATNTTDQPAGSTRLYAN